MSFLKNILSKKDEPIKSYSDFWNWFQNNEKTFFNVVKSQKDIEKGFFDKFSSKLAELKDGYFYLTGMYDDNTVELIFTADGNTNNIVFIEELVEQAPKIIGWKSLILIAVSCCHIFLTQALMMFKKLLLLLINRLVLGCLLRL